MFNHLPRDIYNLYVVYVIVSTFVGQFLFFHQKRTFSIGIFVMLQMIFDIAVGMTIAWDSPEMVWGDIFFARFIMHILLVGLAIVLDKGEETQQLNSAEYETID